MPIQAIVPKPPIKGVIRLGERKEARSGSLYPVTVEHFVLKDAPEVMRVYGEDPKELEIIFPSGCLDAIIPTWYKKFTPSLKHGNVIKQGRLVCMGDGPRQEEDTLTGGTLMIPGTATWFDRERNPNGEGIVKNPDTGLIKRACLADKCADAWDDRGSRTCKQTMQVFCLLPLVSMVDVYIINTSSWGSIRSFHDLLSWHTRVAGPDYIRTNFYKISRVEKGTRYYDKKEAKEKTSVQYIMELSDLNKDDFIAKHSERLQNRQNLLEAGKMLIGQSLLPTHDEAAQMPMDELYPLIEASEEVQSPIVDSEALLEDQEVFEAFNNLEKATGRLFSKKARLISIRKKEGETNVKAAVIDEINAHIEKLKKEEPAVVVDTTLVDTSADQPDDGLV